MTNSASHVPKGFGTLTPYLIVKDGVRAIEYYKVAFGAIEMSKHTNPDGGIQHAEIRIGDSMVMLTEESQVEEYREWQSPDTRGGTPVHLYLYVKDADAVFSRAITAGGVELLPMTDHSYGDRSGGVTDPFGHVWYVATHIGAAHEESESREAGARS